MKYWYLLIISLPTENATIRMRIWRSLKSSGAAVLRDGVYLMPELEHCRESLDKLAEEVRSSGGVALVMRAEEPDAVRFIELFDRRNDFAAVLADIVKLSGELSVDTAQSFLKQSRKIRKVFDSISTIDFFPSEAQRQTEAALSELELSVLRILSPDEPHSMHGPISSLAISNYQGRTWATRCRPWVDRLACAWLIRRFIDPQARLLWLGSPADCPADALGFDFDGATFSHMNGRVSFEVLLASFNLESPALKRLGALVHFLDVGGVQPPEATGIESVLAGLRDSIHDDDQLLLAASAVFDSLLVTFEKGVNSNESI